eukprot:CAMPEP_0172298932 /NCGR_PEP_ID=MMETSP1058-20130122/1356_1 /TAXON_ID=83371 /ORGANISM="Detonula confervacea, Strain CCMP 353" /LENGTH=537 /DNA_ID=CAMNT_0013008227 /DNA_START=15 /DNA_END=1628 /DNA_ORIENTATION=-
MTTGGVHFEGIDELESDRSGGDGDGRRGHAREQSNRSLISAPPAPPDQHRRTSLLQFPNASAQRSLDDAHDVTPSRVGRLHRFTRTFGGVSMRTAYREIRQARKNSIKLRRGWENYNPTSLRTFNSKDLNRNFSIEEVDTEADEGTNLIENKGYGTGGSSPDRHLSSMSIAETDEDKPLEALKEMFTENKINVLFVFLPLAYWSHAAKWSDGSIFILNFLAMVPLASMLGIFTEELAAHTNDVIGGLLNATFGNAVELVVAIQALLHNDFRVVQASLIGSVFSNLLLVLGMCFFCGGIKYPEQEFIAQGAVASIALLAFSGLMLLMPEFFGEKGDEGDDGRDVELTISRIGAVLMVLMYGQLLFFQLKTHVHLFEGDNDVVALIPFHWALIGLVLITGMVTILSEWLVGSIDGFCVEFNLGRSFVGVIILPIVGNAVEHISAVSVAMKNKMDLALGVALGSAVQIALFVLPMIVVIGWLTDRPMSMKFPSYEVYLYLLSVIIVSLCLTNSRSNWLEGSLLVFTYAMIAIGIYFEKDD